MMQAQRFNHPAGRDALGIRKQNDLEQQRRMIRGRTGLIVLVVRVKLRQVHFVVDHVTQRVLKATGENLPLKANRH